LSAFLAQAASDLEAYVKYLPVIVNFTITILPVVYTGRRAIYCTSVTKFSNDKRLTVALFCSTFVNKSLSQNQPELLFVKLFIQVRLNPKIGPTML
jgi:hypothetical protein